MYSFLLNLNVAEKLLEYFFKFNYDKILLSHISQFLLFADGPHFEKNLFLEHGSWVGEIAQQLKLLLTSVRS